MKARIGMSVAVIATVLAITILIVTSLGTVASEEDLAASAGCYSDIGPFTRSISGKIQIDGLCPPSGSETLEDFRQRGKCVDKVYELMETNMKANCQTQLDAGGKIIPGCTVSVFSFRTIGDVPITCVETAGVPHPMHRWDCQLEALSKCIPKSDCDAECKQNEQSCLAICKPLGSQQCKTDCHNLAYVQCKQKCSDP